MTIREIIMALNEAIDYIKFKGKHPKMLAFDIAEKTLAMLKELEKETEHRCQLIRSVDELDPVVLALEEILGLKVKHDGVGEDYGINEWEV